MCLFLLNVINRCSGGSKREMEIEIHTANDVDVDHSHPEIIKPNPSIHAARTDLMSNNMQRTDTIPRLLQDLNRLRALTFTIPQSDRSVEAPYYFISSATIQHHTL